MTRRFWVPSDDELHDQGSTGEATDNAFKSVVRRFSVVASKVIRRPRDAAVTGFSGRPSPDPDPGPRTLAGPEAVPTSRPEANAGVLPAQAPPLTPSKLVKRRPAVVLRPEVAAARLAYTGPDLSRVPEVMVSTSVNVRKRSAGGSSASAKASQPAPVSRPTTLQELAASLRLSTSAASPSPTPRGVPAPKFTPAESIRGLPPAPAEPTVREFARVVQSSRHCPFKTESKVDTWFDMVEKLGRAGSWEAAFKLVRVYAGYSVVHASIERGLQRELRHFRATGTLLVAD